MALEYMLPLILSITNMHALMKLKHECEKNTLQLGWKQNEQIL